ncbi:MAG: hypothetical protein LUH22_19480 [Bacteroides sp.]|nr:hypothetical protein [Bacteroides sp.]
MFRECYLILLLILQKRTDETNIYTPIRMLLFDWLLYINSKWTKLSYDLPLFNSVPIFENDKYICYSLCHGEFGGILFFYSKETQRITYTSSVCIVSILENANGFLIASTSQHLSGTCKIRFIKDLDLLLEFPDSLNTEDHWKLNYNYYQILTSNRSLNTGERWFYYYYNLPKMLISNQMAYEYEVTKIYDEWGQVISGAFTIQEKNYLFVNIDQGSDIHLAKLENDSLVLVPTHNIDFLNFFGSYHDISRKIKQKTLTDYVYTKRGFYVISTVITDNTSLIRIDWTRDSDIPY